MQDTYSSCDGIQNGISGALEFSNAEVSWTLVKAKTNMHQLDMSLEVPLVEMRLLNQSMVAIIEREVVSKEHKGLPGPDTSIS
jgi:hypothetical protein